MLGNVLSKWLKFHLGSKQLTSKALFGGLFSVLLATKTQIIEQVQSPLPCIVVLVVTLGVFPLDKETNIKWLKVTGFFLEVVYFITWLRIIFIWFITVTFIGWFWIWYWVRDQCYVYRKIETKHRMQNTCVDVSESQIC